MGANAREESRALRLARYLKEYVGLRTTTVRNVGKYDTLLWFHEMPQEQECQSHAWNDGFEPGDPWLVVHKQQFQKPPETPERLLPWIDQKALRKATPEIPPLRQSILVPDPCAEIGEDESRPLVEVWLRDRPHIEAAYERFAPGWLSWSAEYRRRDAIQKVYAELFRMHTQIRKQGEIVELVLGVGLLDWKATTKRKTIPVRRHVVVAQVDLQFDPASGSMRLVAAADGASPVVEDDMLEAELRPPRDQYGVMGAQLEEIGDDLWDHARMHTTLRSWAAALHADCQWSASLAPREQHDRRPIISFAPALILRKRTQAGMARVFEGLIDRISEGEVPEGWQSLIEDIDDHEGTAGSESGESAQSSGGEPEEVFFPLPANREQRRIVEAISARRGVLVQGPPGTGKSHTIANLMCHLLATGKRVLITAETGRALQVLKDKLPAELQPLCVSLLGQGGDAFAELNAAVQGITTRQAAYRPGAHGERIEEIGRELDSRRRALAELDTELKSLRKEETCPHSLMNGVYQGTASGIGERVADERTKYSWLRVPDGAGDPPVSATDMVDWLAILHRHDDAAVADARRKIVSTTALPSPEEFVVSVNAEADATRAVDRLAELRNHPSFPALAGMNTEQRARLATGLREVEAQRRAFGQWTGAWLREALASAMGGRPAVWLALRDRSLDLVTRIEDLITQLGRSVVEIPEDLDLRAVRADAAAVESHLREGGKWKWLLIFRPRAVKGRLYLQERLRVDGQPVTSPDQLRAVTNQLDLSFAFKEFEAAWAELGSVPRGGGWDIQLAAAREQVNVLVQALAYVDQCSKLTQELALATPPVREPVWLSDEPAELLPLLDAGNVENRRRAAAKQVDACLAELNVIQNLHDVHSTVGLLVEAVERRDATAYSEAHSLVRQVEQTRRDQRVRGETEASLRAVVPDVVVAASRGRLDPVWGDRFQSWKEAWQWACADNWLRKRTDTAYQQDLWRRRNEIEASIGHLVAESAALRAWTHFFERLTVKEAAALKSWREAVRAMGKGTGRSARIERLRREARRYMHECRAAIPVWIMPRYLVAEMVDPAPGRYDLVIVDEASQLGIESLFLFYIAQKIVVVGDDQQISPYGVGIADEAIAGLQQAYLKGIRHQHALSPQSSLYSNAKIRFGQNIVLREHFRCMPEIIQFSNDLCYASSGTPLDPLRAYQANRLAPTVLRHVTDGYRVGSTQHAQNPPEADAVVAQILACVDDPRYAGLSMGVISLQGNAQAKLIERRLLEMLEPEVIEERRIICGDAYAFQGDERHVMFLSMVAAPGETRIGALAAESARQRFNVAASRAQDQLWLFHSATLDALSPSCMRHHLLSYMLDPSRAQTLEEEQRFESKFERHVFRLITARGFHVRTQVCVGDPTNHRYRIDLVVEGMQGRLAVECDGDEWHGPDQYEKDMARQRDLERAGWQFARIRGGDFYRDRSSAMNTVWEELDRLGIRPGGVDASAAEPPPPVDLEGASADYVAVAPAEAQVVDDRETHDGDLGDPPSLSQLVVDDVVPDDSESGRESQVNPVSPPSPFAGQIRFDRAREGQYAVAYIAFEGTAGPDPRNVTFPEVAAGLCRIIEVEGPVLVKRAYDVYLRGCGIRRMGRPIRTEMNRALNRAVREGRILIEDESGKGGLIHSIARVTGTPPMILRVRGPRTFDEIPGSELKAAARQIARNHVWGSEEHMRGVLSGFDLVRLTTQVRERLERVLGEPP